MQNLSGNLKLKSQTANNTWNDRKDKKASVSKDTKYRDSCNLF